MEIVLSLGWIGIMLIVGMLLRAKISLFRNMLIPSCVIAGIIGFIFMNTTGLIGNVGEDGGLTLITSELYANLVTQIFTLSFISIGLTGTNKSENDGSVGKQILRGAVGMGIVWTILYALTAILGVVSIKPLSGIFDMNALYGLLIPFAFCQGPGQAASFGTIFESYGLENGAMVGVTFAAIGFIIAFFVGVPMAKRGLKNGLSKYNTEINESVLNGVVPKSEQNELLGYVTTHSGNIDSLGFHFALVCATYVLTFFITWIISTAIPPLADTLWGMMFMTGMLSSYVVKFLMKKLKIEHLQCEHTQRRITGWTTDFLIVASFMAVKVSVIIDWIVPILVASAVVTVVTYFVCTYFGKRFGDDNDFERTLGLFGTSTGTVPTGVALIRIVDPELKTTTAVELGAMNIPMMISMITVVIALALAAGNMSIWLGLGLIAVQIPIFMILLKVFKLWGKKTY